MPCRRQKLGVGPRIPGSFSSSRQTAEGLDELVPQYIPSIVPAKYCLVCGEFRYWNLDGSPMLVWYVVPPYGRAIYNFEERRWSYLD